MSRHVVQAVRVISAQLRWVARQYGEKMGYNTRKNARPHRLQLQLSVSSKAEYPAYTSRWSRMQSLPEEEKNKIIQSDWEQYREWLNK